MNFASWNVRGLNRPLTQNNVVQLSRQHNLSFFGLMETKLKLESVKHFMFRKFKGWKWCSNLDVVEGGRILLIWNPDLVECYPQVATD